MRILYIAELVGKAGVFALKSSIKELKTRYPHDFLVLCADGATGGNGLGRTHAAYIHKLGLTTFNGQAGACAITTGECCFYKKDLTENLDKVPFVLRPENLSTEAPGKGVRLFNLRLDSRINTQEKIAVVSLLGQNGFHRLHADNPFTILPPILERLKKQTPYIIVDFHAQATAEKKTLFFAADGLCSAVIGSHTRVQTADETILTNGTACITDAGRTGSIQSVGGCDIDSRIKEYITGIPDWTKDAWEDIELQGVYLDIDKTGKAKTIERIKTQINTN